MAYLISGQKCGLRTPTVAVHYTSRRKWPHSPKSTSGILVNPGNRFRPEELGDLDHFVTARFRLYSILRGKLSYAQIEHPPWPLARATLLDLNQTFDRKQRDCRLLMARLWFTIPKNWTCESDFSLRDSMLKLVGASFAAQRQTSI